MPSLYFKFNNQDFSDEFSMKQMLWVADLTLERKPSYTTVKYPEHIIPYIISTENKYGLHMV